MMRRGKKDASFVFLGKKVLENVMLDKAVYQIK